MLIISIVFAAVIPVLQSLLGNVSLNASAEKLDSSLAYARCEAVARVTGLAVPTIGSPVTNWNVYIEANAACGFTASEEILRVVDITAATVSVSANGSVRVN